MRKENFTDCYCKRRRKKIVLRKRRIAKRKGCSGREKVGIAIRKSIARERERLRVRKRINSMREKH